jgi:polysaccharide deacetylase family protein (PEP-CTERM system associated)
MFDGVTAPLEVRRLEDKDIAGVAVTGYRAASFSIGEKTPWAFDVLAEEDYAYSSSIYPIKHDIYGMPQAPRFAFRPSQTKNIVEIPISTVTVFNRKMPCGGGGYFRLLPYPVSRWAMRQVNRGDRHPCVFYFHPWEIDTRQPRLPGISAKARFRHFVNIGRMERRLRAVLRDFSWDRMDRIFLSEQMALPCSTE